VGKKVKIPLYIGLYVESPATGDRTELREMSGHGYARVLVKHWVMDRHGVLHNVEPISFPEAAAAWEVIVGFGAWIVPEGGHPIIEGLADRPGMIRSGDRLVVGKRHMSIDPQP